MNNNTFVHKYLKSLINDENICVDMTAGNGNDTLFLSNSAKKVYAFDISNITIKNTKEKVKNKNNVILIHDNHANIDSYVNEDIDCAIYNLGYLPNYDIKSITNKDDTFEVYPV